jgi:hypothetical protein
MPDWIAVSLGSSSRTRSFTSSVSVLLHLPFAYNSIGRPGLTDRVSMLMTVMISLIIQCSRRIETDHPRSFG